MNQPRPTRPIHDARPTPRNDRPALRLSHPALRVALGVAASAAVLTASAMLFGPVSDERALAMAGTPMGAPFRYAGVVDRKGQAATEVRVAAADARHHDRVKNDVILAAERSVGTP